MVKKILYSIHRILGTVLSILFLVWFLSGFVMIYHTFPKVANKDKYAHMSPLQHVTTCKDSALSHFADSTILNLNLKKFAQTPVFELRTQSNLYKIAADTNSLYIPQLSYNQLEQYAAQWSQSPIIRIDTLRELDQWIPFGRLKKEFPIYKFYFGDKEEHQLYVSSASGEPLQFTSKDSRFWAWIGAIPHWVYFTSLRQDGAKWTSTVIWLSGLGCIMCITGIIIGIWVYVNQYRRKKKLQTPYRKFAYKWHHILGFVFGFFVFMFTFSGMMSLVDVPQWLVKTHDSTIQRKLYSPQKIKLDNYTLDLRKVLEAYPQQVKSIEWAAFGTKPIYKVVANNRLITIDASSQEVKLLLLNKSEIEAYLSSSHAEEVKVSLMEEYDNYYVGLSGHLPLPVYKAEVNDSDNSTYYIKPKNGTVRYFNTNSRVHKWMYQGLHSFKIKSLVDRPVLWNIIMWTTMLGGTIVSITGVWLGFKYIKRKIKNLKKKYGEK